MFFRIVIMLGLLVTSCSDKSNKSNSSGVNAPNRLSLEEETQLDQELSQNLSNFNIREMPEPDLDLKPVIDLGKELFFEIKLSGNNNISCSTCHNPSFGTSDGLPLSIGEGGVGIGTSRTIGTHGSVLGRHSPALFNLGQKDVFMLFWDTRIRSDGFELMTPEPRLTMQDLVGKEILQAAKNTNPAVLMQGDESFAPILAIQSIFPLLSDVEMRGRKGTNAIADLTDNFQIWAAIVEKLKADPKYIRLFQQTFGSQDINIGHIGRSLAAYISFTFKAINSPFHQYVKGEKKALTQSQKLGMKVFFDKSCAICHGGAHLGNSGVNSSTAVPQIGPGVDHDKDDLGIYYVTKDEADRYAFKIMSLINISETAPYMHDGAFQTLEQVVDHYDNIQHSLENYRATENVSEKFVGAFEEARQFNKNRLDRVDPFFGSPQNMTMQEKIDLIDFLKQGLKDLSFKNRL